MKSLFTLSPIRLKVIKVVTPFLLFTKSEWDEEETVNEIILLCLN